MLAILCRRQALNLHKLLASDFLTYVAFVQEHRGEDHLMHSKKSFNALLDKSVVGQEAKQYIRGERSCTSAALIDLLTFCAVHRRANLEKLKARVYMSGLLHHLVTHQEATDVTKLTLSAEGHEQCDECAIDGVCCHVRALLLQLPGDMEDSHMQLTQLIIALFKGIACPAVLLWYIELSKTLAGIMSRSAVDADLDHDPSKYIALPGNSKRMRIDEDLKLHVLKSVQEGRAATCSALLIAKGEDGLAATAGRKWESLGCQRWLYAFRRSWQKLGTISVGPDASRCGCLAEDTMAYAIWHSISKTGGWLPCQATSLKK